MKKILFLSLLLVLGQLCYSQMECMHISINDNEGESKAGCGDVLIQDASFVNALPKVEIAIYFHFQKTADGTNFSEELPSTISYAVTNGYYFANGIRNTLNLTSGSWVDDAYTNPTTTANTDLLNSNISFVWANGSVVNSVKFYENSDAIDYQSNAMNIVFSGSENVNTNSDGSISYPTSGFAGTNRVTLRNAQRRVVDFGDQQWPTTTWGRITLHEIGHSMDLDHSFHASNACIGEVLDCMVEVCGQACHTNNANTGANAPLPLITDPIWRISLRPTHHIGSGLRPDMGRSPCGK